MRWITRWAVGVVAVVVGSGTLALAAAVPAQAASVTFTVNTLTDGVDANPGNGTCATSGGLCTLRAAIQEANAVPANTYTIGFSVAGTIELGGSGALSPIGSPGLTIDGSTAPGYSVGGGPVVTLRGDKVNGGINGITVAAANVTVRGLRLGNFGRAVLIDAASPGARIVGNQIGVGASGYDANLAVAAAVFVYSGSAVIGGPTAADRNVVGGFLAKGISVRSGTGSLIEGNYIGTNPAGTASAKNPSGTALFTIYDVTPTPNTGIEAAVAGLTIRGNLISGNAGYGIDVYANGSQATIVGNKIGSDVTGTQALGNTGIGILVAQQASATIGGTAASDGNLVVGTAKPLSPAAYTQGEGIRLDGATATIQGNLVGVSAGGADLGNGGAGIAVWGTTTAGSTVVPSTATIGGSAAGAGNTVAGNFYEDVRIEDPGSGVSTVSVQGNRLGVNPAGTAAVGQPNATLGVGPNVAATIGGAAAGAGNVISGGAVGLTLLDNGAGITVQGNKIGTNAAGSASATAGNGGIYLHDAGVAAAGSAPVQIGGTAAGAGNLIAGNHQYGLDLWKAAVVQGNRIGTDASGTAALGNGTYGVHVRAASTTIGGSSAGAGNLISGNTNGIALAFDVSGGVAQGNLIGVDAGGVNPLGNGVGVITSNTTSATIGGIGAGQANTIANSTFDGVYVGASTTKAVNTVVRGNRIYGNGQLAINLFQHSPDGAGNNDQLPPVLTTATIGAASTSVGGTVTASVAGSLAVDVYATTACDPDLGAGEGREYLGTITVNHPGGGAAAAFSGTVAKPTVGSVVTATATVTGNGTSQFSTCLAGSDLAASVVPNATTIPVGGDLGVQAKVTNNGPSTATGVKVTLEPAAGTTYGASDAATFDVPSQGSYDQGTGLWTIGTLAPGASATVCIREDVVRANVVIDVGGTPVSIPAVTGVGNLDTRTGGTRDPFLGNNITSGGATVGSPAVAGAAVCGLPTLTIDDASVGRPTSGTTPLAFTVHLSAAQTRSVTVAYQAVNGTAVAVEDFTPTSGTLTIPAGQTSGTITVPVVGNTSDEPNKVFTLQLSAPKHATLADDKATGTIIANHVLTGCPPGSTPNQRFVCHLYFDALGRAPESGGFTYWVGKLDAGTPRATMATSYLNQNESRRRVADRAYVLYLARHGTGTELQTWADKYKAKTATPEDTRVAVLASGDYYAKSGSTAAGFVTAVFQDVFRRPVDSGGLAYWTGRLAAGDGRDKVSRTMLSTSEGRRKVIGDLFLRFVRRFPSTNEANGWVDKIKAGKTEIDVGIALVASAEYFNRA